MTHVRSGRVARSHVSPTLRMAKSVLFAGLFAGSVVTAAALPGCSWSRFDDATENPAIEVLHAGTSFGKVVAVAPSLEGANDTFLVSFGARDPSYGKWLLGDIENPADAGTTGNYLPVVGSVGASATLSARSTAFLGRLKDDAENRRCWVHGFRAKPTIDATGTLTAGLAVTCLAPNAGVNNERMIGRLPSDVNPTGNLAPNTGFPGAGETFDTLHRQDDVTATVLGAAASNEGREYLFPDVVKFAGWPDGAFAMGVPDIKKAFVYFRTPGSATDGTFRETSEWDVFPVGITAFESDPASTDRSFGASLAVLPAIGGGDGARGLAVAEPTTGRVYLYDVDLTAKTTTPRGCIQGGALEGLTLTGYLDGDQRVLASSNAAGTVHVYDFDAITSDGCVEVTPAATLSCADSGDVAGCDQGVFGAALSHGDLDGDGDQELLVGAPGMNARDKVNAGAVYLYDLDGFSPALGDVLFLGDPKNQSQLGTSIDVARLGSRDVPVIGAPGTNDTMIFYCNAFSKASPRCQ
jgi:hypothetical protein